MFAFFDDFTNYDLSDSILRWVRPFKEKDGYYMKRQKDGKGFIIVFNTLGIEKKDINVIHDITDDKTSVKLQVFGKTEIPELGTNYEAKYVITISSKAYNEKIEDVGYSVRDGLTLVYVKTSSVSKIESHTNQTKYIEKMDW